MNSMKPTKSKRNFLASNATGALFTSVSTDSKNHIPGEVVRQTVKAVDNFLVNSNLVDATTAEKLTHTTACENLDIGFLENSIQLSRDTVLRDEPLNKLLEEAGVPESLYEEAFEDLTLFLADVAKGKSGLFNNHFAQGSVEQPRSSSPDVQMLTPSMASMFGAYGAGVVHTDFRQGTTALESFGITADINMYDIRTAISVRLLRFQKSVLDRLVNRRLTDNNNVFFDMTIGEIYDLEKSQDKSSKVRFGNHIRPLLDQYRTPSISNTTARKVIPLFANAVDGELEADGVIVAGKAFNLLDIAADENNVALANRDFTDLLSDGVLLEGIYIELSAGSGSPEKFYLPAYTPFNSFTALANNRNASERQVNYSNDYYFIADTKTSDGAVSTLLATLDNDHVAVAKISLTADVDLQRSDFRSTPGQVTLSVQTKSGEAPKADMVNFVKTLKGTVKSFSIDAFYNEENLRKAKTAVRIVRRQSAFEIPTSRTLLCEFALSQSTPAEVLSIVNEVNTVGNDDRGLKLIKAAISTGGNALSAQQDMPILDYRNRFGYNTVAGALVNPYVVITSIDVAEMIANLTSANLMCDIAGMMQYWLLDKFANLEKFSLLSRALPDGQKIRWKCLTSAPICKLLLSSPVLNGQPSAGEAAPGEGSLRLPDGTEIDIVVATYADYDHSMTFIPQVSEDRESVLNFGTNFDRGTAVIHYTYTGNQAATKRIATNARELVIPTNYVAVQVDVKNLEALQERAAQLAVTGSITVSGEVVTEEKPVTP